MSAISFVIALILLAVGLGVLAGIYWLVLKPFFSAIRFGTGELKAKHTQRRLDQIDQLIEQGKSAEAFKNLRKLISLKQQASVDELRDLKELYQNTLARGLNFAETFNGRTDNIAEVEQLLMQRVELLGLLSRAEDSYNSLRSRREQAGKEIPHWSKSDFTSRIGEIKAELVKNERLCSTALVEFFRLLQTPNNQGEDKIVYH